MTYRKQQHFYCFRRGSHRIKQFCLCMHYQGWKSKQKHKTNFEQSKGLCNNYREGGEGVWKTRGGIGENHNEGEGRLDVHFIHSEGSITFLTKNTLSTWKYSCHTSWSNFCLMKTSQHGGKWEGGRSGGGGGGGCNVILSHILPIFQPRPPPPSR